MSNITKESFLKKVCSYNMEEYFKVNYAYNYAEKCHENQYRASGEDYIIHPLSVADTLADFRADGNTLCAGLLHDVIEDTNVTYADLYHEFGIDVANLVSGVTNLSLANFDSTEEMNLYNNRKIIMSITSDPRILIIKLIDRLHNMRTLEYKTRDSQIRKAKETMNVYVPLAYNIGAYKIKKELEDLSLKYLEPEKYEDILNKRTSYFNDRLSVVNEAKCTLKNLLKENDIKANLSVRLSNINTILNKMNQGSNINDIHNLIGLKILVPDIADCYQALGIVHKPYDYVGSYFKDYISIPKTNMYRAIHTTLKLDDSTFLQARIKTYEMDKLDSNGIMAYWQLYKGKAKKEMLSDLNEKYQFFKSLCDIDEYYEDDREFFKHINNEIFTNKIYVTTQNGNVIELPVGSTIVDYVSVFNPNKVFNIIGAQVNGRFVDISYKLNNLDNIRIIWQNNYNLKVKNYVTTTTAKKLILEKK